MEQSRGSAVAADARNVAILLLVVVLLWIPRLQGPIDLRWDAGVYYILGTSLAEGRGYRLLNEPGEIEAVQYPPLLPAVVAAVQKSVGTSDTVQAGHALRLLFFGLSLAYALATYFLARRILSSRLSLVVALLTSLHSQTVFLSDTCFSEIPYALVTVLFVLALRSRRSFTAAVLCIAAYLLRSSGLALLAAWVGESLLRRQAGQAVARAAIALALVLLWQGHVARVTRSPAYQQPSYDYQRAVYQYYNVSYAENLGLLDPFRPELGPLSGATLARRTLRNAVRLPVELGGAVSVSATDGERPPGRLAARLGNHAVARALHLAPRLLAGLVVLAGLARLASQGQWLIPLYLLGSWILLSATPWPAQFPRYLAPLAPFLALGLGAAVGWPSAARPRGGSALRVAMAVLVLIVVMMEVERLIVLYTREFDVAEWVDRSGSRTRGRFFYYGTAERSFDRSLDWLRGHSAPAAVVATSAPHVAFLRTGRRAVMPPMVVNPAEAQRLLDSVPVDYLIVDDLGFVDISRRYGEPAVRSHPEQWQLVYADGTRIYRRRSSVPQPMR
jgi:hypothetical protein